MRQPLPHLRPKLGNSHSTKRLPSRLPHATTSYIPPKDRVPKWNIQRGDKVRLLVGKDSDKYIDVRLGKDGGWKVYQVKDLDMKRNRVYLEGLSHKKHQYIPPLPADFDSQTQTRKDSFLAQKGFIELQRPIHYSNVQLCLKDLSGPNSIFATRLSTSVVPLGSGLTNEEKTERIFGKEWDRLGVRRVRVEKEVERFVGKVVGGGEDGVLGLERGGEKDLIKAAWPEEAEEKTYQEGFYETSPSDAIQRTFRPIPSKELSSNLTVQSSIPRSLRSLPPAEDISNEYISHLQSSSSSSNSMNEVIDNLMPVYLIEELSPRFTRAKQTKGWNLRRKLEQSTVTSQVDEAVGQWKKTERDYDLDHLLNPDSESGFTPQSPEEDQLLASLHGLKLRPRTKKEVEQGAKMESVDQLDSLKSAVRQARKDGKVWDQDLYVLKLHVWNDVRAGKGVDWDYLSAHHADIIETKLLSTTSTSISKSIVDETAERSWPAVKKQLSQVETIARDNQSVWRPEEMIFSLGAEGLEIERKRARKARKERRVLERLQGLKLGEGRGSVVPKELRA